MGPRNVVHTVTYPGETLSLISYWYTGKSSNWRMIVDANRGLRPEKMTLGQQIVIPGEIVVEREPLPEVAVKTAMSGSKKADTKDKEPTPTEPAAEEPSLEDLVGLVEEKPAEQEDVKKSADPVVEPTEKQSEEDKAREAALAELLADDGAYEENKEVEEEKELAKPAVQDTPVQAKPADPEAAEREKLLDELLAQ